MAQTFPPVSELMAVFLWVKGRIEHLTIMNAVTGRQVLPAFLFIEVSAGASPNFYGVTSQSFCCSQQKGQAPNSGVSSPHPCLPHLPLSETFHGIESAGHLTFLPRLHLPFPISSATCWHSVLSVPVPAEAAVSLLLFGPPLYSYNEPLPTQSPEQVSPNTHFALCAINFDISVTPHWPQDENVNWITPPAWAWDVQLLPALPTAIERP